MLDGDLAHTPVSELVQALAAERASGLLTVREPAGAAVRLWLRAGRVVLGELRDAYGRPQPDLLHRLQTAGMLDVAQVTRAREASPLPIDHLLAGGLLRRRRLIPIVTELLLDAVTTAAGWASGSWQLDPGAPVPGLDGMPTEALLNRVDERARELASTVDLAAAVQAVPRLVPFRTYAGHDLAPEAWAVLAVADGTRSADDVAAACGLTIPEAVHVVGALVEEGMLRTVPERSGPPVVLPAPRRAAPPAAPPPVDDLQVITAPDDTGSPGPDTAALLREFGGLGLVETGSAPVTRPAPPARPVPPAAPSQGTQPGPPIPRLAPAEPPTPTDEVARKRRLFGR